MNIYKKGFTNLYDYISVELTKKLDKEEFMDIYYFAEFYCKYEHDDKWEYCFELIKVDYFYSYEFDMDFDEGQQEIKDLVFYSAKDIKEILRGLKNEQQEQR